MDIFKLYRNFWDYCFSNPEKIKPTHIAIYSFAIEHCNRLGWKVKFGFPTTMVMEATGIKSYSVYKKHLDQLIEYGLIDIIEYSKNQFSANIIALKENNKAHNKATNKALDKALIKHSTKQLESSSSIIKQETKEQLDIFEVFRKLYPGTKLGLDKSFSLFKKHKDWEQELIKLKPALENEINYKEYLKNSNQFCAQWKNLSTWINQRCWEQEFENNIKKDYISKQDSERLTQERLDFFKI